LNKAVAVSFETATVINKKFNMRFRFFLLLLLIPALTFSQGRNNFWLSGYNDSGTGTLFGTTNIDFNFPVPFIYKQNRPMNFFQTFSSMSDTSGNLLFYTNGVYVSNQNDDTLYNGNNFNSGALTDAYETSGLTIPQGTLIIPSPNSNTQYYLFSLSAEPVTNSVQPVRLTCSLLDMNLDGGLGGLIWKDSTIINDTLSFGLLTACKHGNGRDWWISISQYQTGCIYQLLITPSGISSPALQCIGQPTGDSDGNGQAVYSPDGNKFAIYDTYNYLQICDFDRCTGIYSNPLFMQINDTSIAGGAAFAPGSRYLYASSTNYIYQFDMLASNILNSKTTIATFDGFTDSVPPFYTYFYLSQLAPDGKIYLNTLNGSHYLHVINQPDSAGTLCDVQQHSITLPTYNRFTIPNFPNYSLSNWQGSVCDSLQVGIEQYDILQHEILIYPNPAKDKLFIKTSNVKENTFYLMNAIGQILLILKNQTTYTSIDLSQFPKGIYLLKYQNDKMTVTKKIAKQ